MCGERLPTTGLPDEVRQLVNPMELEADQRQRRRQCPLDVLDIHIAELAWHQGASVLVERIQQPPDPAGHVPCPATFPSALQRLATPQPVLVASAAISPQMV